MDHTNCPHCRASIPAPRSRLLGGLALGLAYVVTLAFAVVLSCLGPLGLTVLPFYLPGAIAAITAAHTYASAEHFCLSCGKLVELESPSRVVQPVGVVARA